MEKNKEKEEKITNCYVPSQSNKWVFAEYYKDWNPVNIHELVEPEYSIEIRIEGVAIWTGPNKTYVQVLQFFQIDSPSPQEAMLALTNHCEPKDYPHIPGDLIAQGGNVITLAISEKDKLIIGSILFQKVPITIVWREFDWTSFNIKKVLNNFNTQLRGVRRDYKKCLNKKRLLNEYHIETLKDTIREIKDRKFTVADVHWEFLKRDKTEIQVKHRTIYRRMQDSLGLTFKKWELLNSVAESQERRQQIYTAAVLWEKLLSNDFHLVYADEFKFISESNTEYWWSKRGQSVYKFVNFSKFSMSFMLAFSSSKIEGIVGTNQTFNANKFRKFVMQIFQGKRSNVALVVDNARIHTASVISDLWQEQGILMLAIPAYSPFCNPCERLILRIKSKARKLKMSGSLFTLQTFKRIWDEIEHTSLQDCIAVSLIETYYFIKNYSK